MVPTKLKSGPPPSPTDLRPWREGERDIERDLEREREDERERGKGN